MNQPAWQRAKELYLAARGLEPEARRQFLDKECAGDAELREEVEQLLDTSVTKTLAAEPFRPVRQTGLNQGDMIGHFQIEAQIGRGGFGLVYRATDTQLRRTVAIKILRDGSVSGETNRLRFAREAVAASALNHANIVTVYQTGSEAGMDYIVMEYISGETLRSQIGRRGLPVAKCLRYAAEIADAVAAAHEAGIVHRDLKPGNVMINERGRVKVLDFGLAKSSAPGDASSPEAAGEAALTVEGALIGTYAYMSPEQAEGKPVDSRSDIFSFGCMLYEMIAGRQPFRAESNARTLSAILDKEPPPIGTVAPGLPREVEHVIEGCLRKDPPERWQNLADVKKLLEHSLKNVEARSGTADAPATRRYGFAPVLAGVLGGALLACLGLWVWKGKDLRAPLAPEPVVSMLTADAGLSAYPALSKDGKMLAYASDRSGDGNLDIWVKQIGAREPIRLTNWESDESDPDFSPDGTRIAFRSEKDGGGIYVTSTFGGEPVLTVQGGRNPKFSPNGRWIAFWSGREAGGYMPGSAKTFLIPVGGGQPQALGEEFAAALYPVWSPTGESIMILGRKDATDVSLSSLDWWVVPLEKGAARRTSALQRIKAEKVGLPAGQYWNIPLVWLASPDRVLFSGTLGDAANLWELPFDARTQVAGPPRRVTFGSAYETQMARADPSQQEARLAYASLSLNFDIWSLPLDAERGAALGEMKRVTQEVSREWWPSLSWDGTRLAFWSRQSRQSSLRTRDLRSGRETTILSDTQGIGPRISGDGLQVFYTDTSGNAFQIASRGGAARTLCEKCGSPTDANRDGSRILLEPLESPEYIRSFDTATAKVSQLVPARENLFGGRWSRDQRWVAFHGLYPGSETSRVYIAALGKGHAPPPEEWIPITSGKTIDRDPAWSPEGKVLYFLSERDGFRCVWAQRLNPAKKTPLGEPFCVQHFHTARRTMSRVGNRGDAIGLSISGGLAVFALGELTGNIWLREEKH